MKIFDGKLHATHIDAYIKQKLAHCSSLGELLIVLIGDNPVSLKYIGVKMKLCKELRIPVRLLQLSVDKSDDEIFSIIEAEFKNAQVMGGIIQLPLPRESLHRALDLIPPHKDVDRISSINLTRFYSSDFSLLPPVVRAASYFLLNAVLGELPGHPDYIDISRSTALLKKRISDLKGYIIGDGFLVGKPVTHFLNSLDASIYNNRNYIIGDKIYSDFLILGVGQPKLVAGQDISQECHVLDFGISIVNQKIVGDLDKDSQLEHLGLVSFSPGGIGPVVVRFLLLNFLGF